MKTLLLVTITALMLSGCKEKPDAPQPNQNGTAETANHQHQAPDAVTDAAAEAGTEQTTCPVMGGKINKDIYTDYQGKRVYFCCAACKPEFEKNPKKYIGKLPQFRNSQ